MASFVVPHQTVWFNPKHEALARLKSRRRFHTPQPKAFPDLNWGNNVPAILQQGDAGRVRDAVVIRYFRQLPPQLVLRDATEDLFRPLLNIRRLRYTFTLWGRPRILRCSRTVFCIIRGVGAGEQTPSVRLSPLWRFHVQDRGAWKDAPTNSHLTLAPSFKYWHNEL